MRINYDEEKLTELAQKRRASRIHRQSQSEGFSYTNHAFCDSSPTKLSIADAKEFDNELYQVFDFPQEINNASSSTSVASSPSMIRKSKQDILQADDDCLKIDIELLNIRKPNNLKQSASLASLSSTRQRGSRESFSSIKNIFQGTCNVNSDKFENDLYGLVEDSEDTKEENENKNEMVIIDDKLPKKRRGTEFEMYVPMDLSNDPNNFLFTKI